MKKELKPNKKIGEFLWNHQDLLGSGAFGKVYRGYHETTHDIVAIKEQDLTQITDDYMKQALKNEISIMKKVKSKNIVNLQEVYQTSRHIYMIIDFCNGGDLRSFLTKSGVVTEEKAIQIMTDILSGFKALVEQGIIHRDVKPENILINDGVYKLADFGLSRVVDNFSKGMLQTGCGTPLYMAPQILMNKEYTTKCDIWSIGLMFYEMVFGNTPWPCRSQYELVTNVCKMPLRFPHKANISEETRNFIKGCLTVDESKRYGWNDCFNSKFLGTKNVPIVAKLERKYTFDEFSKIILTKLQKLLTEKEYSLEEAFNLNKGKSDQVQIDDFTRIIMKIDPQSDPKDIANIFRQIDTDGSHSLSFEEIRRYIFETDYGFSNENVMLEMQRAEKLLRKLGDVIIKNNLDIQRIFRNFDKSKDSHLNFEEFKGVLKTIDENISDKEALYIFHKFDSNKDGSVSVEEFKRTIYTENQADSSNPVHFSKPVSGLAAKAITDLKFIVASNGLDINIIFRNFDSDKSGFLAFEEFRKLVNIISNKFTDNEINEIFKVFDSNNDQRISYEEFKKYLS